MAAKKKAKKSAKKAAKKKSVCRRNTVAHNRPMNESSPATPETREMEDDDVDDHGDDYYDPGDIS